MNSPEVQAYNAESRATVARLERLGAFLRSLIS
jgi:hypothetical protein